MSYLPTICVILFLLLFLYCTTQYPGSSQFDIQSVGFSWQHNYWCDILDRHTYAEVPNPASKWGIFATLILCIGTAASFYQFPNHFSASSSEMWIISGFGILSMLVSALIFTPLHNQVIGISSGLALIAILAMFYVLFQKSEFTLFYYGVFACVVMLINNYIYYSKNGVYHLPWIQKISIVIVLVWIVMLNIQGVSKSIS